MALVAGSFAGSFASKDWKPDHTPTSRFQRPIDRFVELLPLGEVIGSRAQTVQSRVAGDHPLEQVGRQDRSLGEHSSKQISAAWIARIESQKVPKEP